MLQLLCRYAPIPVPLCPYPCALVPLPLCPCYSPFTPMPLCPVPICPCAPAAAHLPLCPATLLQPRAPAGTAVSDVVNTVDRFLTGVRYSAVRDKYDLDYAHIEVPVGDVSVSAAAAVTTAAVTDTAATVTVVAF